jgi:hypothetical protein
LKFVQIGPAGFEGVPLTLGLGLTSGEVEGLTVSFDGCGLVEMEGLTLGDSW